MYIYVLYMYNIYYIAYTLYKHFNNKIFYILIKYINIFFNAAN